MGKGKIMDILGVPLGDLSDTEIEDLLSDIKKKKVPKYEPKTRARKSSKSFGFEEARIDEMRRLIQEKPSTFERSEKGKENL